MGQAGWRWDRGGVGQGGVEVEQDGGGIEVGCGAGWRWV